MHPCVVQFAFFSITNFIVIVSTEFGTNIVIICNPFYSYINVKHFLIRCLEKYSVLFNL